MTRKSPPPPAASTIGDLIEVPPIRTVVQLVDSETALLRQELLESFVFTGEIRQLFERLLLALSQPTGLGAFLKGHYGSGKSHCLTFLRMLLEHDEAAWSRLPVEAPQVRQRGWVVVSLPLVAFSAGISLESAVMTAIEDALEKSDGQRPMLADQSRFLEHFQRYIVPAYPDLLEGWADLAPDQRVRQGLEFLRSLPENPLQLHYDRRQTMELLAASLGERGIVLLLDELSEFLRSKGRQLNEDIRYLQFLGEWAEKLPLFIVATLQQDMEELVGQLDAEANSYLRIKERYPLRFALSARHVADLIEGRLIKRKPGSDAVIRRLHADLDRAYPGLIKESDFLRIYPVHPATLDMLESLMTLFSRHRGVVDFVHTRLAGNPLKGAEGILHEAADRLLTPDAIFDHFRERFRELAELAPYEQTVYAHLTEEIPKLFTGERDREMALQCLKLLILASVSPVPVETTAVRMAQMLARRISRIDPEVNLAYLRERILDVLVSGGAFVVKKGERYLIELSANLHQIVGNQIRELRKKLVPDWTLALGLVNRASLPLADILGKGLVAHKLRWKNAERTVLWGLLPSQYFGPAELSKVVYRLQQEESDVAIWLVLPGDEPERGTRLLASAPTAGNLVFWTPAVPDQDLVELLLTWQAHRSLLAGTRDKELRNHLEGLVKGQELTLERAVHELYAGGKVEGPPSTEPPLYETTLDKVLLTLAAGSLSSLFPKFAAIAPRIDGLIARNLEKLWEHMISPGKLDGEVPGLEVLVEGILLPLQLVQKDDRGEWRLHVSTEGPVGTLLDLIPVQQRLAVNELQRLLHKSPWGLVRTQFLLVLASLAALGRVQLFAHGRPFTAQWRDFVSYKFDEVGLTQRLEARQIEQLESLRWMVPDGLTPARPREFFAAAREKLGNLASLATEAGQKLSRVNVSEGLPVAELTEDIQRIQRVAAAVGQPTTSTIGLQRLLETRAAELEGGGSRLERWIEFLRVGLREYEAARRRLSQMGAEELLGQLQRLSEHDDPLEAWRELQLQIEDYDGLYRQHYQEAHEAYYAASVFGLRKELLHSSEWKGLERLSEVLGIGLNLSPLRSALDSLPTPCRRAVAEELILGVRCGCGFERGQAVPGANLELADLQRSLSEGARSLVAQEHLVESYIRNLHQLGQENAAAQLDAVCTVAAALAEPSQLPGFWARVSAQLHQLLTPPVKEALSRALTGHTLLVSRSLESLHGRLADQRLPVQKLRQLFEEWLNGPDLRGDSWVHLEAGGASPGYSLGPWLQRWLEQHGLEATPSMRRRYRLEGECEGEPPEEELWEVLTAAVGPLEAVRAAKRERIFPRLSRELCRRVLREAPERLALPELDWEHLEVARLASAVIRRLPGTDYLELAPALANWARAVHLDLAVDLLEEDLVQQVGERLGRAVAESRLEAIPLENVPEQLVQPLLGERKLVVVVLDGLRWDLWLLLREQVVDQLGAPMSEQVALSPLPSVTIRAREVLLGGDELVPAGADGLLLNRPLTILKAADEKRHRARAEALLRGREPAVMLHLNFIDKRRHETGQGLWPLYTQLLDEARLRLIPLLKQMPSQCLVLLTADHGFLDPGEARAHGGARWEERAVPAVVWVR